MTHPTKKLWEAIDRERGIEPNWRTRRPIAAIYDDWPYNRLKNEILDRVWEKMQSDPETRIP